VSAWAATARARVGSGLRLPWILLATLSAVVVGVLAATSPWVLICVAATVAATAAILRWPLPALLTLLALRATSKSQFLDLLVVLAGSLALLLAAPRLGGRRVWLPFGVLLLLALPTVPFHPSPDEGAAPAWLFLPKIHLAYLPRMSVELLRWLRLASVLVVFLVGCWAVRDERDMSRVVVATLVSAVVPVLIALEQFASGHFKMRAGVKAIEGPFSHPDYFAFYLVVVLIVCVVALFEVRRVALRAMLGVLLALSAFCLLETYMRGAWIGFALSLVALGLLRYRSLFVVGAVVLVVAFISFPGTVHKVEQRFGDLSTRTAASSNNSWTWRTGQWRRMLHFGSDKPLTGQGFGSYSRLTVKQFGTEDPHYGTIFDRQHPLTSQRGFDAHNDYVSMFVEMGVPGLCLWVAVLVGLLGASLRARRWPAVSPWACAGAAVMIAVIFMSAGTNIQASTVVLVYVGTLVGALTGATVHRSRARVKEKKEHGAAAVAVA
jgi:putative inorganic carbon (hco3(-)) transporter